MYIYKNKTKNMDTTKDPRKIITDEVRFSYCHVWEPSAMDNKEGAQKKYSVSIVIPKSNKALVKRINDAVQHAITEGVNKKWNGKQPPTLKLPLRDGDKERAGDEVYKDSWFVNASATNKPSVVDSNVQPIMNQDEFYSGCYGKASINFYAFNASGNKGIACGLNHLMKTKDGEKLGGRASVEADFGEFIGQEDDI